MWKRKYLQGFSQAHLIGQDASTALQPVVDHPTHALLSWSITTRHAMLCHTRPGQARPSKAKPRREWNIRRDGVGEEGGGRKENREGGGGGRDRHIKSYHHSYTKYTAIVFIPVCERSIALLVCLSVTETKRIRVLYTSLCLFLRPAAYTTSAFIPLSLSFWRVPKASGIC